MTTPSAPRKGKKPASVRTWLIRAAIVSVVGLAAGGTSGVIAVRTLEPGHPERPDSQQVALDSMAKGTVPTAKDKLSIRRDLDSAEAAQREQRIADSLAIMPPTGEATVPNVVGIDEGSARAVIAAAGFTVGTVQFRPSRAAAGTVLGTVPVNGAYAPRGAAIAMVLSDGHAPPDSLSSIELHQP